MKTKDAIAKEKEKVAKMKALRREIEADLEEQLLQGNEVGDASGVEVHKVDTNQHLEESQALRVLEALLFASSKPLSGNELKKVLKGYTPGQINKMVKELQTRYLEQGRSFEIIEIAGGYEIVTKKEFAPWIIKVELQKKVRQATQSALETLAILAYKQPMTRAEIEELRGVDVSGVVNTLMERSFIKIVGKKEVPGRPFLYGTTEKFLEHFGLNSLKDLPNLDEIKTIVESSVKRDELLGKSNVVEVEEGAAEGQEDAPSEVVENSVEAGDGEQSIEEEMSENTEEVGEDETRSEEDTKQD